MSLNFLVSKLIIKHEVSGWLTWALDLSPGAKKLLAWRGKCTFLDEQMGFFESYDLNTLHDREGCSDGVTELESSP